MKPANVHVLQARQEGAVKSPVQVEDGELIVNESVDAPRSLDRTLCVTRKMVSVDVVKDGC